MKIIFLDLDWVLIPIRNKVPMDWLDLMWLTHIEKSQKMLSQDSCFALAKIIKETWAKIVISSSWRHHWEQCRDLLYEIPDMDNGTIWNHVISRTWEKTWGWRATEILMWIDDYHKTCKDWWHITDWMAIDDEYFDMKAISRTWRLTKTDGNIGLTIEEADKIISLFNH